jgi:xylulokinase
VESAVDKLVHVVETVEPDTELVEKYEKCYRKFKKYYPALKGLF